MKQRSLMKRVSAVLMAAALTISTFPQFHTNVYAAENQLPTKEQFATVEELKSFNTNDNDGKIRQRFILETTINSGGLQDTIQKVEIKIILYCLRQARWQQECNLIQTRMKEIIMGRVFIQTIMERVILRKL